MGSLEAFQEQFTKLKVVEAGKNQLIEVGAICSYFPYLFPALTNELSLEIVTHIKELQNGLTETKLHLEREQATAKLYQSEVSSVKELKVDLKKLNERIVWALRNPFTDSFC